ALSRLTSYVRLCFDGDKAGVAATERSIPIAEMAGVELGVTSVPAEFKGPDEIIQNDLKQWQQVIEQPQPAVEWIIDRYKDSFDLTTAAGKRGLSTKVLEIIRLLSDPVEQEHYVELLSTVTGASSEALKSKLSRQ